MFVKYSTYNKSRNYLSLKRETLSLADFIKQYKYSGIVPPKRNNAFIQLKNTDEVHVLTAVYNYVSVRPSDRSKLNEGMMTVEHNKNRPHF